MWPRATLAAVARALAAPAAACVVQANLAVPTDRQDHAVPGDAQE